MKIVYKRMSGELVGTFHVGMVPRKDDRVVLNLHGNDCVFVIEDIVCVPQADTVIVTVGQADIWPE